MYSAYQVWLDSFAIFSKYILDGQGSLFADEGNIWAGPNRELVSDDDHATLEKLGWKYDEDNEAYVIFAEG
jgi:hypothetical protein